MNDQTAPITEIEHPEQIIAQCVEIDPSKHALTLQYGNPQQPLYGDTNVELNGINYDCPVVLPLVDGQLQIVQCAVLQHAKPVAIVPYGIARGFAYLGELKKDKPIIVTHNLEAFFKVASSGVPVVLVPLPNLCRNAVLKPFDFEQIHAVINQLSQAGYNKLYMPVRPENIELEAYQQLEQQTAVRLLNQYIKVGESEFLVELNKHDAVDEVLGFIGEAIYQLPKKQDTWGELIPLQDPNTPDVVPYPIGSLPNLARQAIEAIAEHVQAPIAMTAQCVIGAMSHIAQAKVNAPHPFNAHGEPCGLFLLTEGQSGSRKSTSRNMADKAIIQYERKQYEQYRRDLEQWKSQLAGLDKKDKEQYLRDTPPPSDPITRYSDITLEAIAGLYVDGCIKNASISSDEAGQFFGGNTMKSDTRNHALGGYAKLFDDGSVERTRSKSNLNGSGRAYDVRLTFNLQGQHEVLSDALKDPVLRGQGFLPRFILTIPENLAGTRLQDPSKQGVNASLDQRLIAYWYRCEYLLDDAPLPQHTQQGEDGRYVIQMNTEAQQVDLAFYNDIERLQGKGQCYEYLQAFASRASQLARRLATVFAYFEGLQEIDAKTLQGACDVIKHSLGEWLRYAEVEAKQESEAEKLIQWLVKKCQQQNTSQIAYSYMQTSCPRPMQKNTKLLEMIIQQLEDSNYLRVDTVTKKRFVVLNPFLLQSVTK